MTTDTAIESQTQIRPWVRYFARTLDLYLCAMCLTLLASLVYPQLNESNDILFFLITALLWIPVEMETLHRYGTTPGKALLKTKIEKSNGEPISRKDALDRSLLVWSQGMAFGIPLFSLFTNMMAYIYLDENRISKWDEKLEFTVTHSEIGNAGIAKYIGVFVFTTILVVIALTVQDGL